MEEKSIKSIPLANDLSLELLDLTRDISVDACQVTMVARLDIPVKASLFSEETLKEVSLEQILSKVGPITTFEHRKERNFIMAEDKNKVFAHLCGYIYGNPNALRLQTLFSGKICFKVLQR